MHWWWWIIPGAVAVIGLAIALSGVGWMLRGRPFKGGRGAIGGGFLLAVGAVVGLIGLNIQTYNRLSEENPVATLALKQTGDRVFAATVTELNDKGEPVGTPRIYDLNGDQWQVDARVITWKSWAAVLGLDAQYELENIWGRDVANPNDLRAKGERLVVERPGIDLMAVAETLGNFSPVQVSQRDFGSAVYMPMYDGAVYNICITEDALVVDAANELARAAVAGARAQAGRPVIDAEGEPRCQARPAPPAP
jgi:hypothetical protein